MSRNALLVLLLSSCAASIDRAPAEPVVLDPRIDEAHARPERVARSAADLHSVCERALADADPEGADEHYRGRLEERRGDAARLRGR